MRMKPSAIYTKLKTKNQNEQYNIRKTEHIKVNHIVNTASAPFPTLQMEGGGGWGFCNTQLTHCVLEQKYRQRKRSSEKQRIGEHFHCQLPSRNITGFTV